MDHKLGTMRTGSCTNRLHTHGYITTTHTCNAEHSQNPSHDPHSLTPTVSQSMFAACTASMCMFFVQSILTTGCHSDEQTVEYTYTFLIYAPHPDSTLHRCFSPLFPFFPSFNSVFIHPLIITVLILPALSLYHNLSLVLQWL